MGGGPAISASTNVAFNKLLDPRRKWYNNKRLFALHAWIILLLVTSYTTGYDGSMMNGLQSLSQWTNYFNSPSPGMLGLLNAIQNIGGLAAYPIAPYLCDGLGRRTTIFIGASIMCAATALQSASHSVQMFIGARQVFTVLIAPSHALTFAINNPRIAIAAPLLVTEVSYPKYRAPLTSAYNSLWYSGAIVAAWTTFGTFKINNTWAWRIPSILQGLPSVLQVLLIYFVPESPRWLVSKGREAEALKVLAYYHADGNEHDHLVHYEFEEIKASIDLDRTVAANVGWKSLFTSRSNLKRMRIIVALAFFSQWSGNGLVSYYLHSVFDTIGITDLTTQLLINGILQIWNLFWALLAAGMVERLGRRPLFLTSAAGMLVSFLLQTVCSAVFAQKGTPASANAVIAFIFLFYAFYDLAFSPLIVSYTVEILPFSIRAKGFCVFQFAISLSLIFNQYANPIALKYLGWKYYIFYVCFIAFEFVFLYIFVVETKGRTLEETAALFDGEEAVDQIASHVLRHDGHADEKSSTLIEEEALSKNA
ncbi:hypothetical protein M378DRAFT_13755 [Amanita muscaria Koide BX008]|uniref:Major facilitator superfamily (MFS) profile domain-containing protein n=1 Tax=Amanita muscaria (strain Koide BX008) TaxID=946122 RepID=A0A0C2SDJ2_AMAMK|nr:hypothetical protein M378DRAFT_13755 [Amanita muscaria Koide BX008]